MSGWKAERCGPKPEDRAPAAGAHDATQTCQHAWWRSRQSRATDGQLSVATALRYDRWAMDLIISLGEESCLALSCDLRSSLQSCCVVQGAAEHLLLGGTAMHHAPACPVATLIYGAVLAWESITWTRDRRCKKKSLSQITVLGGQVSHNSCRKRWTVSRARIRFSLTAPQLSIKEHGRTIPADCVS